MSANHSRKAHAPRCHPTRWHQWVLIVCLRVRKESLFCASLGPPTTLLLLFDVLPFWRSVSLVTQFIAIWSIHYHLEPHLLKKSQPAGEALPAPASRVKSGTARQTFCCGFRTRGPYVRHWHARRLNDSPASSNFRSIPSFGSELSPPHIPLPGFVIGNCKSLVDQSNANLSRAFQSCRPTRFCYTNP